jgi:hypothetical protein
MSHYLLQPTNLANEVVAPVNARKMRERHHQNQRAATVVKDDDLWKELQQELAKAKCISQAGIREITREFMKKLEGRIDAQTLKAQEEAKNQPKKSRRSSNEVEYSRRSSLSIITEKGQNIRRALSMGNGDQQLPQLHRNKGQRRDSMIGTFMNNSLSKMNSSMNKLRSMEARPNKFFKGGPRSQSDDTVLYTLDQATNIYDGLPDMTASLSSSYKSSISKRCSTGALDTHIECSTDDELSRDRKGGDGISCDSDDDLDGELLVLFPTRPRRRSQTRKTDMARTA